MNIPNPPNKPGMVLRWDHTEEKFIWVDSEAKTSSDDNLIMYNATTDTITADTVITSAMITSSAPKNSILVSNATGSVEWSTGLNFATGEICFDYNKSQVCLSGKSVYQINEHLNQPHIHRDHFYKEATMWTFTNICIVSFICIVTVKLILPRLTIKNFARAIVTFVCKPFRKVKAEVNEVAAEIESELKK